MLILVFLVSDVHVYAQGVMPLPAPGTRLALSSVFAPPLLKGIKVYRNDPFRFDFILDKGDGHQPLPSVLAPDTKVPRGAGRLPGELDIKRLIKYFLASLTVPEKDLWVNLSPYEKDRIVPEAFGQTEMGRDLLAQDYILKQITASVIYPEDKIGKEFWGKVYAEALKRYGTTDIPVDTFNKVWITPEKATVYEHKDAAYVVESKLKVMLETDYLATGVCKDEALPRLNTNTTDRASFDIAKQVLRDIIIPILEKEINEGQNFATLRQVYNSLILATWYKRKVKASIMGQAYVDQKKVSGIDIADKNENEKIWSQYVDAFKKGAFDLIKEEKDPATQEILPRKYFSGGVDLAMNPLLIVHDFSALSGADNIHCDVVKVRTDFSEDSPGKEYQPLFYDVDVFDDKRPVVADRPKIPRTGDILNFKILPADNLSARTHPLDSFPYPYIWYQDNHPRLGKLLVTGIGEVSFLIVDKGVKAAVASPGHNNCLSIDIRAEAKGKDIIGHAYIMPHGKDMYEKFKIILQYLKSRDDWENVQLAFSEDDAYDGFPDNIWINQLIKDATDLGFHVLAPAIRGHNRDIWQDSITTADQTLIRWGQSHGPYQYLSRRWRTDADIQQEAENRNMEREQLDRVDPNRDLRRVIMKDMRQVTPDDMQVLLSNTFSPVVQVVMTDKNEEHFPFTYEFKVDIVGAEVVYRFYFQNHIANLGDHLIIRRFLSGKEDSVRSFNSIEGDARGRQSELVAVLKKKCFVAVMRQRLDLAENSNSDRSEIINKNGGIDLNPSKIDMTAKNSGEEIKFNMDPAMLQRLQNAPGVIPVIMEIHSLDNLSMFLGVQASGVK
ncbi:MAG: hypothetical protein WCI27_04340 [Candidatus Omnitrophota bacterium]